MRAATSPQSASRRVSIGKPLAGDESQAATIAAHYRAVRLFGTGLGDSASLATAAGHLIHASASLLQAVSVVALYQIEHFFFRTFDVATDSVVALQRGIGVPLATFMRLASASVHWSHKFLPVGERSRVIWLPPPQGITTLPPQTRRIVLPPEEDELSGYQITQPEPLFFSPFDPNDEDIFTFDWSRRAYPNDRIVFASITSVPAGVNFLGPAFIDGLLVDITVGPFDPLPVVPVTYALRCRAVFASGRISNYSIPVVIMTL